MNRTACIYFCIPLIMTIGCRSARVKEVATEPNGPQEQEGISIDSRVSDTEPNASCEPATFTLSGSLGTGDVTLKGLPGDPNSVANGTYNVTIDAGWSGTVTPEKAGFLFMPPSRSYEPFTRDIHHEIYIPQAVPADNVSAESEAADSERQALSGILKLGEAPIQGITLRTIATSTIAVTDANGFFSMNVPADWAGTLRLEAPARVSNEIYKEEPALVCRLEAIVVDSAPATKTAANTPQMEKIPIQDEPLITLGTPCLSDEATHELEQDLRIMCQLLSEAAFGISLVKPDPNSQPRPIYLAGEGVLFNICLDWPLADQLPEPNAPEQSAIWKTAREYIQRQVASIGAQEELHQMKTHAFIQKMTHSLIHAANIRHLDEDNHITLHIWGPPPSGNLVIRARLKDIKDYAEAALTEETFEEQVVLKLH